MSSQMNQPQTPLFVLADPSHLRRRFKDLATIKELTENILYLNSSDPACKHNLYLALQLFFGRDSGKLSKFLHSLLDSASLVLEQYSDIGHASMLPLEATHWRVSRSQCRGLLANAFLGNIGGNPVATKQPNTLRSREGLNFHNMMMGTQEEGKHKILCLIQYFDSTQGIKLMEAVGSDEEHTHSIVFDRIKISMQDFRSLPAWGQPCLTSRIFSEITTAPMETEKATCMVNFANSRFGVGQFLSCCTQEEILQMCCPEINVGMLIHGEMEDDTVVVVKNVKRYSTYTGYLRSFQFKGPETDSFPLQTIAFMDATINYNDEQFTHEANLRDIRKAYLGFLGCSTSSMELQSSDSIDISVDTNRAIVSTGQWGCGAFGGDPVLKCLQQMVAAALCGNGRVHLIFSSFRNNHLKTLLENVVASAESLTPEQLLDNVLTNKKLFRGDYSALLASLSALKRNL